MCLPSEQSICTSVMPLHAKNRLLRSEMGTVIPFESTRTLNLINIVSRAAKIHKAIPLASRIDHNGISNDNKEKVIANAKINNASIIPIIPIFFVKHLYDFVTVFPLYIFYYVVI
ncbi:MAG: hypothetical protein K2J01_05275 [Clostridiales bacterium]|nr:hypothetical protein [Clostridiales bacterium]